MKNKKGFLCDELIFNEINYVLEIVDDEYQKIWPAKENLSEQIEKIVAGKLVSFLRQLPNAILKYISESPYEKFEERLQTSLKFCCKLNLIEYEIPWELANEEVVKYFSVASTRTHLSIKIVILLARKLLALPLLQPLLFLMN
ncbi:hypothetical protein Sjap_008701 [Stephania japonica]|uniref:Uncharacterized protein n=1 Tax=Stephania japonica TaxID=461633 RepID=A0AAP0JSF3_9MAGN